MPATAALVRHPVLDRKEEVVGYELSLGSRLAPAPSGSAGPEKDAQLLSVLAGLDLHRLAGGRLTLVSVGAGALERPEFDALPPQFLCVLVRPGEAAASQLRPQMAALAGRGFTVGLDESGDSPLDDELLGEADWVRLDASRLDGMSLADRTARLTGRGVRHLIAGSLHGAEDYEACRALPFEWFEGAHFVRPRKLGTEMAAERATVFELLNLVDDNADVAVIERVFRRHPELSYRLLRYINSAACGLGHEVHSIAHALMLLGHRPLYRWLTLLLFTAGGRDPGMRFLLVTALIRGRLMELLGHRHLPAAERDGLFLVGVFSLLDRLLGIPMDQALTQIRLAQPIVNALLNDAGSYAPYLRIALACEGNDPGAIATAAGHCGMSPDEVNGAHIEALAWVRDFEQ